MWRYTGQLAEERIEPGGIRPMASTSGDDMLRSADAHAIDVERLGDDHVVDLGCGEEVFARRARPLSAIAARLLSC